MQSRSSKIEIGGNIIRAPTFFGKDVVGVTRAGDTAIVSNRKVKARGSYRENGSLMTLVASASTNKVAASDDWGTVFIWDMTPTDTKTVNHVLCFRVSSLMVDVVAFSPCGTKLLCLVDDKSLWVVKVSTGALIHAINVAGSVIHSISFTKDGNVSVINSHYRIVGQSDMKMQKYPHKKALDSSDIAALMSPDETKIVGASSRSIFVIDISTNDRKDVWTLPDENKATLFKLALSPDGKRAAIVTKIDTLGLGYMDIVVLDATTWTPQLYLDSGGYYITNIEFSPESDRLLAARSNGAGNVPPVVWTLPPDHFNSLGLESRDLRFVQNYKEKLEGDRRDTIELVSLACAKHGVPAALSLFMLSFIV